MATKTEINEVRKVIYKHKRWRNMEDYLNNVGVAMNIGQPPPNCHGAPCRNGFYPSEGAQWCDRMAEAVLSIRADLVAVNFNRQDKKTLRTALLEDGRAWRARARAWRAVVSNPRANMEAYQRTIDIHFNASVKAYLRVKEYLR